MAHKGGLFGAERIDWFNGGLFDNGDTLPLTLVDINLIDKVSRLDWSQVEPAIFGTLFERGLDPSKRTQLGAHYTDRESIMRLIEPVLLTPLRRDLEETKEQVETLLAEGKKITARTPADRNPQAVFDGFLDRLRAVRVLDPACGSGNFLYLALQALKDLEREAILWGSLTMQTPMQFPQVGPQAVLGIELNPYAAELARVVIWIGEIQWMLSNGFAYLREPILRPLHSIECRDAVLDLSDPDEPREPEWPAADVIIGNPPFLGAKLLSASNLGRTVCGCSLPRLHGAECPGGRPGRVLAREGPGDARGRATWSGSVFLRRRGSGAVRSRRVLERIKDSGDIFLAWSDEPWVVEGAAVHVSFLGYDDGTEETRMLDGRPVDRINAEPDRGR